MKNEPLQIDQGPLNNNSFKNAFYLQNKLHD